MTFRRFLLLAMLVALGLCAAVGVLAVFVTSGEHLGRVLGTLLDTAVATGLLLPVSFLIPRAKLRIGGLTAMGVILFAWLCVLAAIWTNGIPLYGLSETFALTALFVLFMGVPSAGVLLLLYRRQARTAALTFVSGAVLAWLACELSAFNLYGPFRDHFLSTGLVLYGLGTLAAALLVNLGCGDQRFFRWAGVTLAACGLAMALWDIWALHGEDEFFAHLTLCVIIPAIVMAHINLVLMARLRASQAWLKWGVCGLSILSGLLLIFELMRFEDGFHDLRSRASAAAGIVAACGSLALIVLAVLNRKTDLAARLPGAMDATALELTCPRCRHRQTVPFGESSCAQCELQFSIKITEPRCPACGYLLYRLSSARCPECGAPARTGKGTPLHTVPGDTASP